MAPAIRSIRVAAPGIGAVRRLGDADLGVLGLLEQVDEPQAVLGQEHAVGVERQHVVGVGDDEVGVAVRTPARARVPPASARRGSAPPIRPM